MKIGIVSDTHRNTEMLESVVDWLISRHKITTLYHLGDDYDDVKGLAEKYLEIVQVPGIYDDRYKNGELPAKLTETVLGLQVLLVHSYEKDVTTEDVMKSDILLYGHTHKPEIRLEDGRLYLNPGHLKGPIDKNNAPSFGMLSMQDREIQASIFGINFKPIQSMEIVRSENGLYKAG